LLVVSAGCWLKDQELEADGWELLFTGVARRLKVRFGAWRVED
jgi:hypothetical protein